MPGPHFCVKNLKTAGAELAVHSHFTTHSLHFSSLRITEWLRLAEISGVTRSNPLLKQVRLEPLVQDHVQMALEYLQGDSISFLSNLCQCSVTLTVKMCFLVSRQQPVFLPSFLPWHQALLQRDCFHPLCTLSFIIFIQR